ncbi:MAG: hypothetical protein DSY42_08185 [Aquifex sp.]|nr:MAG: hypothetical protein DSY42_08185 [Aquifex sp.]
MKKGLLVAGAVFSLGILAESAKAVTVRVNEEQVLKFGFRGIIDATLKDKRSDGDTSDIVFSHREARIYAKYRLNKIISFGFQAMLWSAKNLDAPGPEDSIEVIDSFINLAFAPEFNVIAGSYKVPFERHSGLQSGWTVLFPTGPAYGVKGFFTNPVAHKPFRSGSRSAGLTFWGNIADGMFKYYVGVFDTDDETKTDGEPKTAFSIRVQFTPTMMGYKPEKGYVLKNTYVGKKDVLTIGISYANQDFRGNGYDTQDSLGIDLMWEQKFGTLVPNIQIGYVQHNNYGGDKTDDRTGWLIQGQLLYDQKVFLGKPALVVRYMQGKYDDTYARNEGYRENKPNVLGIGVNYFIKGSANRISLAIDNITDTNNKDYTDVTLSIFYNF